MNPAARKMATLTRKSLLGSRFARTSSFFTRPTLWTLFLPYTVSALSKNATWSFNILVTRTRFSLRSNLVASLEITLYTLIKLKSKLLKTSFNYISGFHTSNHCVFAIQFSPLYRKTLFFLLWLSLALQWFSPLSWPF